ncbi:MAG: hypothetical protein ACHP7P_17135 [Terriglobales bacterium]
MDYVLFMIDCEDGREVYAGRAEDNSIGLTPYLARALKFETARLAYDFGRENNLLDMKAGYR